MMDRLDAFLAGRIGILVGLWGRTGLSVRVVAVLALLVAVVTWPLVTGLVFSDITPEGIATPQRFLLITIGIGVVAVTMGVRQVRALAQIAGSRSLMQNWHSVCVLRSHQVFSRVAMALASLLPLMTMLVALLRGEGYLVPFFALATVAFISWSLYDYLIDYCLKEVHILP